MELTLTQSGKRKAKDISGKGPESSLLSALEENGPSDISDLAKDLNTSQKSVKKTATKLAEKGFIRKDET